MTSARARGRALGLWRWASVAAGLFIGCDPQVPGPCGPYVVDGMAYRVTILGWVPGTTDFAETLPRGDGGGTSCGEELDFAPGDVLVVRSRDTYKPESSCYGHRAEVADFGQVAFLEPIGFGGPFTLSTSYRVRIGKECEGMWYMEIDNYYFPTRDSRLHRNFVRTSAPGTCGSIPGWCGDYYYAASVPEP